jgi:adenosine/AMP kinase
MADISLEIVKLAPANGENIILGQSHFIKTVEDIYEAIVETNPAIKFGVAFCEASADLLIRHDGNDDAMAKKAIEAARRIGAGHSFVIWMTGGWPLNIINRLMAVSEVVNIFAATSNTLEVIVAETSQGRGIMGVIDGNKPVGVETPAKAKERKALLRGLGYKR